MQLLAGSRIIDVDQSLKEDGTLGQAHTAAVRDDWVGQDRALFTGAQKLFGPADGTYADRAG